VNDGIRHLSDEGICVNGAKHPAEKTVFVKTSGLKEWQ